MYLLHIMICWFPYIEIDREDLNRWLAKKAFFEWEATQCKIEKICREEQLTGPASMPEMVTISVDGKCKH